MLSQGFESIFYLNSTVMYPDSQYFYNEDDDKDFFCPKVHDDKEFSVCLASKNITERNTTHDGYRTCIDEKKKRFNDCNQEHGYKYILKRHLNRSRPIKCDKFNVVYSLTKDESNLLKPYDECSRPFVVQKIAHSNLILLITNRNCAQVVATDREFNNVPQTIEYNNSTFCHKLLNPLFRSRPKTCMTYHENVSSITLLLLVAGFTNILFPL